LSKNSENGFGAALRADLMGGSPLHCPNQTSIVVRGESYVYDGSHSADVMKKVKGRTQAELGWGTRLANSVSELFVRGVFSVKAKKHISSRCDVVA
jgi:hypothetical protein